MSVNLSILGALKASVIKRFINMDNDVYTMLVVVVQFQTSDLEVRSPTGTKYAIRGLDTMLSRGKIINQAYLYVVL